MLNNLFYGTFAKNNPALDRLSHEAPVQRGFMRFKLPYRLHWLRICVAVSKKKPPLHMPAGVFLLT